MSFNKTKTAVFLIILISAALFPAWHFFRSNLSEPVLQTTPGPSAAWRAEFTTDSPEAIGSIPKGWKLTKKPGTSPAVFSVQRDPAQDKYFLHMEADKASGNLITSVDGIDIAKSPLLRWRWRATVLPNGADGRVRALDDQAIGIYIGSGSTLSNKSISYRWDTETPKGTEGNCSYGMGTVKVKWFTLRNKEDVKDNAWLVEERNIAEDFKQAWGFYPEKIYLSVSCNSQYTGSRAGADLDWVEFTGKGL